MFPNYVYFCSTFQAQKLLLLIVNSHWHSSNRLYVHKTQTLLLNNSINILIILQIPRSLVLYRSLSVKEKLTPIVVLSGSLTFRVIYKPSRQPKLCMTRNAFTSGRISSLSCPSSCFARVIGNASDPTFTVLTFSLSLLFIFTHILVIVYTWSNASLGRCAWRRQRGSLMRLTWQQPHGSQTRSHDKFDGL